MTKFRGNPWAVLLVVSLGFFMTLLDLTIVNIAIPNLIAKLHASLDDVLWVINAYALVLAVLVITAGRLGDLIGPRTMFMGGVAVFTAASAACGLAPNPAWLIGFRAVQGLGAAMLMPQTLTIITSAFPADRRGAAFGVWGAVAGVATVAGPTLGGLLVTAFDWRWIFFVNLPIGVCLLLVTPLIIPDVRPGRRHRIDIPGVLLASAALLAICYGLVEGQKYDWGTITGFVSIPLVLGLGVLLLLAFLLVQRLTQAKEPLVPFALFRDRNYSVVNWVSGVLAIGMMGIFIPLTIYFQSVLGFSALKAGLTMAPASLVSMFVAPVAGRMTDKIGGKFILMSGLILFGAGMGWIALIAQPGSSWPVFTAPLIVAGLGMGCVFAPMATVAMRNIDPRMAGAASGVLNTIRQVGSVIGTAAVGALLQNRLVSAMADQASTRSAALPPQVRDRFVAGIGSSARNGIQVGAGQSGGSAHLGPGLPARVAAEVARIGHEVFVFAYVTAMRQTMLLPIILLGVGALSCLAIKQAKRAPEQAEAARTETATPAGLRTRAGPGQMAGAMSSPGSSGSPGQSPGSSPGTASPGTAS